MNFSTPKEIPQGNPYPGLFVELEGSDGTGKGIACQALAKRLAAEGIPVTLVREPGGTPEGEQIRNILLADPPLDAETNLFLFSAARRILVQNVIRPALARGNTVISDRYYLSTLVYQGLLQGLSLDDILAVTDLAVGDTHPDLRVVLTVSPETAMARMTGRGKMDSWDKIDSRLKADAYLDLAERFPSIQMVSAEPAPDVVQSALYSRIQEARQKKQGRDRPPLRPVTSRKNP